MYGHLAAWGRRISQRVTLTDDELIAARTSGGRKGIVLGAWDEDSASKELTVKYRNRTTVHHEKRDRPENG